ncbi:MAG TPA: M48 family metallopeptidase [Bacteroidales bacterium]
MKKILTQTLAILFLVHLLIGCSSVPITGRKHFNMIPDNEILSMSFQEYNTFLKENKVSTNKAQTEMVKNVGKNIQLAVEKYLNEHKYGNLLDGYQWEFNLVESPDVNAWCMPGGKVVVYTGILPVTKDETGLAVVMGHEIAHAVAEHGSERMSQAILQQAGALGLSIALSGQSAESQALWMNVYGVGSTVGVMLPYSRLHETEADHLGLIFMAMAGYNPQEAPIFWERMAQMSNGQKPPQFLSTHPSDETRIANLNKWMPEAMKYYSK